MAEQPPENDHLADHVEAFFPHLRAALEGAGVKARTDAANPAGTDHDFDHFYALTMHRVRNVGSSYRESWRTRDMPLEAAEEASDFWVYVCGELAKNGGEDDGHLYQAAFHAYRAFKEIRQHQAKRRAT